MLSSYSADPEFPKTSAMPLSSRIVGCGYRLHSRNHFYDGDLFCKTFEDGPWKWDAQERYCAAGFACGHYLARTREGALAEAKSYNIDLSTRGLLEVEAIFDNILDLTWERNIREVLNKVLDDPQGALLLFLRALVHTDRGGNDLTDEVGLWAMAKGYSGILYFSARTIEQHRDSFAGGDWPFGIYVAASIFETLRNDMACQNLAILSGPTLVRSIKSYCFDGSYRKQNPYFGVPIDVIDRSVTYGQEYRRMRNESWIRWGGKTSRVFGWDGKIYSRLESGRIESERLENEKRTARQSFRSRRRRAKSSEDQ